ncbi:vWA domain-containing protein [Pseudobacteriovorax antillogorgiicola]|uniref:VWFA domain-containing protein n=1 Tax=Pseudobacteriovorax antillogorgiicola TaxID=1513793 RepID=A0A1Y6C3S6_9BACT|nr:vWA domain-containing protein [Pseudobacteriovorax antillogorgiicola]TCS49865.1 hypothetical protein EDD56_114110 [Pseudobacteriovorax antillogorgiicola]SMF43828.1 hypothetical protein SAMN06296036_113109 [Pseudobacteriovorax antillogorgiicola]
MIRYGLMLLICSYITSCSNVLRVARFSNQEDPITSPIDSEENSDDGTGEQPQDLPFGVEQFFDAQSRSAFDCDQDDLDFQINMQDQEQYAPGQEARLVVDMEGRFCSEVDHTVYVLFLVDFSESMGIHLGEDHCDLKPGYDPLHHGSCHRLKAIDRMVRKLEEQAEADVDIRIAMIPFADSVVSDFVIDFVGIQGFKQAIKASNTCRYLINSPLIPTGRENPGGLSGEADLSEPVGFASNYSAAFMAGQNLLLDKGGRKAAILLSDGLVNAPGEEPFLASLEELDLFKQVIPGLEFASVRLGNAGAQALEVLSELSGDRVRTAKYAEELVEGLAAFPAFAWQPDSLKIQVSLDGQEPLAFDQSVINKAEDHGEAWLFSTKPIKLGTIEPGEELVATVSTEVQDMAGEVYSNKTNLFISWD